MGNVYPASQEQLGYTDGTGGGRNRATLRSEAESAEDRSRINEAQDTCPTGQIMGAQGGGSGQSVEPGRSAPCFPAESRRDSP